MLKDATAGGSIFEPGALFRLADQLHNTTIARDYALTFLNVLRARVNRILATTAEKDAHAAMDAVLSLKVNAHMVGALAIEEACHRIEQSLRKEDMPAAAREALALPGTIAALTTAMTDFLSRTLKEETTARQPAHTSPSPGSPDTGRFRT